MALDHYVPQVHLRNFYSHELGRRMYGLRKSDLRAFTCRSEDVCRIEAGSTNPYLKEPRIIADFLTEVEPYYNASVDNLRSDTRLAALSINSTIAFSMVERLGVALGV